MKISEMKRREPFVDILVTTLANGWSEQYKQEIQILSPQTNEGNLWLIHPLLNACYPQDIGKEERTFLRDNFRYTSVLWRRPFQWLGGTWISSGIGMKLSEQPIFRIKPSLPTQDTLLVVPGNQRIRIYNFTQNTCRVLLKCGFNSYSVKREIEVRTQCQDGPFPPIKQWSNIFNWFEEPILDAYTLPRCPSNLDRKQFESEAIRLLQTWLTNTREAAPVNEWLNPLMQRISENIATTKIRFGFPQFELLLNQVNQLALLAIPLGSITVANSHGDFQAGNIMIERHTHKVFLIDWEHCAPRFEFYDLFSYGLKSRSPLGLAERLIAFIKAKKLKGVFQNLPNELHWRQAALALFLLEDINWYLSESTTGPYHTIPDGLKTYAEEMQKLGIKLERLFG